MSEQQTKSEPIYKRIHLQLTGNDGNAFSILARLREALQEGGVDEDEVSSIIDEAKNGDYDHLLSTAMKYVSIS